VLERSSSAVIATDPGMLPCWWRTVVRADGVHLLVGGELDMASADLLDEALRRLEIFPLTSHVDLSGVTSADVAGLEPLAASARRRARNTLPPLDLIGAGDPVHRIFELLNIAGTPARDGAARGAAAPR
jgi:hypothetical protein